MRQLLGLAIFVAVALPLAADDKDDAMKKLNGTFDVVSVTFGRTTETPSGSSFCARSFA